MTPADKKKCDELMKKGRALMNEASAIQEADDHASSSVLVGRYFKVRSNYSDAVKPKDYWWIYSKILRVGQFGSWVRVFSFATDVNSIITVKPDHEERNNFMTYGDQHKEIKAAEFIRAWHKLLGNMHAIGLE